MILFLLQGLIEPSKEISKIIKKQEQLRQTIAKLEQAISANDYETKVPVEIRNVNAEKLSQSKGEIIRLTEAVASLKTME